MLNYPESKETSIMCNKKVLSLFLLFGFPYLAYAHPPGSPDCQTQVIGMASLVKSYHETRTSIKDTRDEVEQLKQQDSLTAEDQSRLDEFENDIRNLREKGKTTLRRLNSKSQRVLNNCQE